MSSIFSTLLFVGAASAQITTSMPFLRYNFGTDKIGFYGSVIGASDGQTTMFLEFDNGTDWKALHIPSRFNQTVTVAPTMFAATTKLLSPSVLSNFTNVVEYGVRCEIATASPEADSACTLSYDPVVARALQCPGSTREPSVPATRRTELMSKLYTYSGRGTYSGGVETIVQTFIMGPDTSSRPSWCTDESYFPESGLVETVTIKKQQVATCQVIITAGQEKLSATHGASVGSSSAKLTAASGTGSASGSTGAAMPMKTAAPMVVSLGAAIAAFVV